MKVETRLDIRFRPPGGGVSIWRPERTSAYRVEFLSGGAETYGGGTPQFTLSVRDRAHWRWLEQADAYSAAMAFVKGEFEVHGDMVAAVRFKLEREEPTWRGRLYAAWARFAPHRLESLLQSRARAEWNIRFHYDRSNEFYRQFLDSKLVYSCAYFRDLDWDLEHAQEAKLDLICRKLAIEPGEKFLDIGCGWGALVLHAAARYGALATGCTLSRQQFEHARKLAVRQGLADRVTILDKDYRDVRGRFDKAASVGMFEHVGRRRMPAYFAKVRELLTDGGLFLNHGIMRPEGVADDAQTLFLQRRVFPGGELPRLGTLVRQAEEAGFEVLDIENLRPHYALTCRAWVQRLEQNREKCIELEGEETWRTWLLYLAGSAVNFERGDTAVYQMLLAKRGPNQARRLSREYVYR